VRFALSTRVRQWWLVPLALIAILVPLRAATATEATAEGTAAAIQYRIERRADMRQEVNERFTPAQLAVLEKLNRADVAHLPRLPQLVIPDGWVDELQYSPFPPLYPGAVDIPKILVVDLAAQAFAAYEKGRLIRWGPVSSGRQAHPTPTGLFHLNWRARGRYSTEDPRWYMEWYINFHNARGLALHRYAMPGYPASHACVRLLERDAIWMYDWGQGWTLDARGEIAVQGTPLIITGQYAFGAPPPWRSLDHLAHGINLPESPCSMSCRKEDHVHEADSPRSSRNGSVRAVTHGFRRSGDNREVAQRAADHHVCVGAGRTNVLRAVHRRRDVGSVGQARAAMDRATAGEADGPRKAQGSQGHGLAP
jgi:lipoprotein-anchoring transpeptidase ErfK/SrfK